MDKELRSQMVYEMLQDEEGRQIVYNISKGMDKIIRKYIKSILEGDLYGEMVNDNLYYYVRDESEERFGL